MKQVVFKITLILCAVSFLATALFFSFRTKGDVATMVAGFWSALATIGIGFIALSQNRRFKDLADKTTIEYYELQTDIKNLTDSMAKAIGTLKKIETAKYYPLLEKKEMYLYKLSKDVYIRNYVGSNYAIQHNYVNVNLTDCVINFADIVGKYNIFAFCLRNIGEKPIRNFICKSIKITTLEQDIEDTGDYSMVYKACDVNPGQLILIFIANLPDYPSVSAIELEFSMENLIMEQYLCKSYISFFYETNREYPREYFEFTPPYRSRI